jgi:hypothetical protein
MTDHDVKCPCHEYRDPANCNICRAISSAYRHGFHEALAWCLAQQPRLTKAKIFDEIRRRKAER